MNQVENILVSTIKEVIKEKFNIDAEDKMVMIEIPKDNTKGDYSTNIAMRLTKMVGKKPQDIAADIKSGLEEKLNNVEKIEIAGPGFINFWINKADLADVINTVLEAGDHYGDSDAGKGFPVLLEYVSANPTGILHLGHARGAAWGDACARLYKAAGYNCLREYYINDAGNQMDMLALSVQARYRELFGLDYTIPEDGYQGKDIIAVAEQIKEAEGDKWLNVPDEEALPFFKAEGKRLEMKRIEDDLKYYRCDFDSWMSEQWIVDQGMVDDALKVMIDKDLTFEEDGAFWFRSSKYGDDKDRVLRKSDGFYTYLTPDIANHIHKFDRGYKLLVNLWGADHHGYVPRMKAAIEALGYPPHSLEVDIIQMVRLVENGQEVKMSKRTGNAVTIRELCDDIGVDAARYFFLSRALDSHLDFDLGLARSKSNDNPVFYAQYAYARISSILRQAGEVKALEKYDLLGHEKEVDLLKYIAEFPGVVADAAATRSPNKVCNYIQKLASFFHSFYGSCKINDATNPELSAQRLALALATKTTLKNALSLLGVDAPEKMETQTAE